MFSLFPDIITDLHKFFRIKPAEDLPLLFTFNPSHELALADNHAGFTPNAMVAMMDRQLFLLPLLFARQHDLIFDASSNVVYDTNGDVVSITGRKVIPFPWGWNRAIREKFRKVGVDEQMLPGDDVLQTVREMASRRFAAHYLCHFQSLADSSLPDIFVGHHMTFHQSLDSLCRLDGPMIFKQPWSTSGRGNFVTETIDDRTEEKLKGFLRTQGGFLSDRFYEKTLDFAMEFYVYTDGKVDFVGYSLFKASENGKYGGNLVADQHEIKEEIGNALHSTSLADELVTTHRQLLSKFLGKRYTGFVGVDMMAVKMDGSICCHPCVEINLRMNMGLVAMQAYRRPFLFLPFSEGEPEGAVLRSSAFCPSPTRRERGFHTLLKSRFISIIYS